MARDRTRFSLREVLTPRDGSETAVWTGALVFVLALAVAGLLIALGGHGTTLPDKENVSVAAGQNLAATGPLDRQGVWDPYYTVIGGGAGGSDAAQSKWKPVVRRFVSDFLNASHDAQWLSKAAPLVSPQLLRRLHWVVRAQVPTGTLGTVTLDSAGAHVAQATVSYTSGGARRALGIGVVDLPKDGRGWMVYSYQDATP
jgi:hypothetical protein